MIKWGTFTAVLFGICMYNIRSTNIACKPPNGHYSRFKMSKPPSEADIIFNKVNVALAKQQRLVSSWLPAPTPAELAKRKTEEELEKEDHELFKSTPELLGVGAKIPDDDGKGWSSRTSTDLLRRKLLGKSAKAPSSSLQATKSQHKGLPLKHTATQDESDTDEGRTAHFSSKRTRKGTGHGHGSTEAADSVASAKKEGSDADDTAADGETAPVPTVNRPKRKANTFLDDMLEEKAKKRKKNKKNKGNAAAEGS
ncbi:hypothetical protein P152DRAFT_326192 [Eremomyces bilateralis CBS 781.70]|uniref:Uncharacterized protein n=1 Tax=Eremomyces bilateralis CBS 781.70 TaxID=1392243 RepID=A0A6G1G442_9PEZI|nr:uncharacterized protein P152DRAFT_326192 [Eremomyces bilateralis CBS 781.70]KAF1812788.1 hypothetical protein P152DRAFT_326192 [Eremomyces bilateralis CBS 781.70]